MFESVLLWATAILFLAWAFLWSWIVAVEAPIQDRTGSFLICLLFILLPAAVFILIVVRT